MNSGCVNMCVTLCLCMCIFLWLLVCGCVPVCRKGRHACLCLFVGAMTATWTWELFIIFLWRHHRDPEIRLFIPLRRGALLHPSAFELDVDCEKLSAMSKYATNTISHLLVCTDIPNLTALYCVSICRVSHGISPPFCIYAAISFPVLTGEISLSVAANKSWAKYSISLPEHQEFNWILNQPLPIHVNYFQMWTTKDVFFQWSLLILLIEHY